MMEGGDPRPNDVSVGDSRKQLAGPRTEVPFGAHRTAAMLGRRFDAVGTMSNDHETRMHTLRLSHKDGTSSALHWDMDDGEIASIRTSDNHKNKGVATAMLETAHQMSQDHKTVVKPKHSRFTTGPGQRFIAAMKKRGL